MAYFILCYTQCSIRLLSSVPWRSPTLSFIFHKDTHYFLPLGSHFHHHNESTKQHTLIPTLDHFAHPQAELDDALVETSTSAAQTTLVANLHLEKGSLATPKKWADHRSLGISWDFLRGKSYIKNGCIWRPLKILKHVCFVWIQWE